MEPRPLDDVTTSGDTGHLPLRVGELDTRLLLAFRAVVEEGTFSRAAFRLGYTQSAISQQIASLERVLGAPVFDRPGGPRRVELTSLGRLLLRRSAEVMTALEALVADVEHYRSGEVGSITIGTIQSTSTALLPTILRLLLAERPGLEARMDEQYEETELIEMLRRGDLDVTFLVNADSPGITSIDVLTDPFVVVARAGDVPPGPITAARMHEGPLIGQVSSTFQDALEDQLREVGCEPDYVFRSADNGVVLSMVRAGLGLALLPRLAVLDELDDTRLTVRSMDPPIPDRVIRLAWRDDRPLSPAARRFCDLAIDVAAEMGYRYPVLAPGLN